MTKRYVADVLWTDSGHTELVSPGVVDVVEQLATTADLSHKWEHSDLIEFGLGPQSMYALSDGVLRDVALVAGAYLEDVRMFETHFLAAHAAWLTDDDSSRLTHHSTGIAHCPASNSRHASGVAPVVDFPRQGIPVGLGTDGPASHSRLDRFEEMHLALRIARLRESNAEALTPIMYSPWQHPREQHPPPGTTSAPSDPGDEPTWPNCR